MRFFLGPMSKNVVDVVLEIATGSDKEWTFIPSRRQIECTGGYVNNWTTRDFQSILGLQILQMYRLKEITVDQGKV